jgi:hypothetical protein
MDVTGTLSPAWDRTKRVLFRPFDLSTWFSFGVIFFVQSLIEGSPNFSFNRFGSSSRSSRTSAGGTFGIGNLKDIVDSARKWMSDNMGALVIGAIFGFILLVGLGLVFMWLGTRGQMMSIRAVSTGRAAVGEHWRETRKAGWDLFKLQLILAAISAVVWMPLLILAVYRFVDLVDSGVTDEGALVLGMTPFVVVSIVLALVFAVVHGVVRNLVAPVMLRYDLTAGGAWARFRVLAPGSFGPIALFFLIRFGVGLVAAFVATVVTFCTCCIGGLPVINQTLLAPWHFFERAYGLYVLESIGPDMKMLEPLADAFPQYPPYGGGPGFAPPGPPPPYSPWGQS